MQVWDETFWRGPQDGLWLLSPARRAFANAWIQVEDHDAIAPSGAHGPYGIVRFHKLAVGVLPIAADGGVHLVGQWRVPLGRYSWEMPEGGAEPGEDPREAAQRELEEEAGVRAGQLIEILRLELSNSVTDEQGVVYLGLDLREGHKAPDPTEHLAHAVVPFPIALDAAARGWIRDSLTVAALFRAAHMAHIGAIAPTLARRMIEGDTHG
jgi:8-oxo-dGTP pyrophosphatase MutT (NUDIX family)